eukprot:TRINITY_DN73543_c0_g1_i1.p1 TRINITY_DN73543_c0_g1~~TRINITY_DN73543_c0_g1_i1.p1  ORF type:complete len:231 (-),score=22.75 TRINITY_DN73543_c0_g1_i1:181-873(-)
MCVALPRALLFCVQRRISGVQQKVVRNYALSKNLVPPPQSIRNFHCTQCRTFQTTSSFYAEKESPKSAMAETSETPSGGQIQTSFAQKTKEGAKTASYGTVIVIGAGIFGAIAYSVFNELFSSNSPNGLFEKAADQCMAHTKVQDMLGEPIKAYGEEDSRGRRTRVSHLVYQDEKGKKGIRVQFYLMGRRNSAIAQLDAREDSAGKMQTRFLVVTVEDMLRSTIIVQDNR